MADGINVFLEEMLPELEALKRKKIFTVTEVQSLVKRRTKFEYAVRKPRPDKVDFVRYAEYEQRLHALIVQRAERLGIGRLGPRLQYAGPRRVHFVFTRALRKFSDDVQLWLRYIRYAIRSKSTKTLNRAFARALQLHPLCADLWIAAASFEYSHNHNVRTARVLMQRGLRMLGKSSQAMWHEYFRLELLFLEKVRERLSVLGVGQIAPRVSAESIDASELPDKEEDEDADMDEHNADELRFAENASTDEKSYSDATNPFLSGAIPILVYRNAIKAIPNDVNFRLGFLRIYSTFDESSVGEAEVLDSLIRDFPEDEHCWAIWARQSVDDQSRAHNRWRFEGIVERFERACCTLPTEQMILEYVEYLLEQLYHCADEEASLALTKRVVTAFERCQDHHAQATEKPRQHTPDFYHRYVDVLLNLGLLRRARELLDHVLDGESELAHVASLWQRRLDIALHAETPQQVLDLYARATAVLDASESDRVWCAHFEYLFVGAPAAGVQLEWSLILERIKAYLIATVGAPRSATVLSRLLYLSFFCGDLNMARQVFSSFVQFPPLPLEIYLSAVRLERAFAEVDVPRIRRVLESAVGEYGSQSAEVWASFLEFERSKGSLEHVNRLRWRAQKNLSPSEFIRLETISI